MSLESAISDYNARYLFVKSFPKSAQCNPKSKGELWDLLRTKSNLSKLSEKDCPSAWQKSRCQEAVSRVKTWIVDFEWSEAAQKVGVDFAAKNCPVGSNAEALNRQACVAFKKWNQNESIQNSGTR